MWPQTLLGSVFVEKGKIWEENETVPLQKLRATTIKIEFAK